MSDDSKRIDFYILEAPGNDARTRFACRLSEKAFGLSHRVHALTADAGDAARLDDLMWTYRAGSFLPHTIADGGKDSDNPVTIGCDASECTGELLINLTDDVPACFEQFERVAEIVDASEEGRQRGRRRFGFYRDNGYQPQTHRVG
jgi:DNA polymerase-3 subunit chi